MPPRGFIGEVIVRSVLVDGTAESQASLHACVCRIGRSLEGVDGLEIPIAEVSVAVGVEVVRAGAGEDVADAAGAASIFGGLDVGDAMAFRHRLLRASGSDAMS